MKTQLSIAGYLQIIKSVKARAYRHSLRLALNTARTRAMTWPIASVRHIPGFPLNGQS